jgi:hypothetical protein
MELEMKEKHLLELENLAKKDEKVGYQTWKKEWNKTLLLKYYIERLSRVRKLLKKPIKISWWGSKAEIKEPIEPLTITRFGRWVCPKCQQKLVVTKMAEEASDVDTGATWNNYWYYWHCSCGYEYAIAQTDDDWRSLEGLKIIYEWLMR